jgi:hypothetical protein
VHDHRDVSRCEAQQRDVEVVVQRTATGRDDRAVFGDVFGVRKGDVGAEQLERGCECLGLVLQTATGKQVGRVEDDLQLRW